MTNSVELARQFESLETEMKDAPSSTVRLSLLMRMWPILGDWLQVPSAKIYIDEYRGHLRSASSPESFADLTITDHRILLKIFRELGDSTSEQECSKALLKKFAYVGAHQELISLLSEMTSETSRSEEQPTTSGSLSELRQLHQLQGRLDTSCPKSAALLEKIISEWETEIESHTAGEAWCLCVQDGPSIPIPIGSLARLSVQLSFAGRRTDEKGAVHPDKIAFASQLRSSDDPAVGGVRRSLQAVRKLLTDLEYAKGNREQVWSIDIQLRDQQAALTGESLSLAASVAVYTALLQHEVTRTERLVSSEVAFIGSISEAGKLEAVNEATLEQKLRRAFFSHLKYVVLPSAHRNQAELIVAKLTQNYPLRKLRLVFAETLTEVVENHNVIRPEKLCPGVYVSRLAGKYATSAYVLAPFLLIVSYLLLSVVYPRAAIWFDESPAKVKINAEKDELIVMNAKGDELWRISYPTRLDSLDEDQLECVNLDSDQTNEVAVVFEEGLELDQPAVSRIVVYDDDGTELWHGKCVSVGEYPPDSTDELCYHTSLKIIKNSLWGTRILTWASTDLPARSHVRLWSPTGDLLGWYVSQGISHPKMVLDVSRDGKTELIFAGYNNRIGTGIVYALPDSGFFGVSPPYIDKTVNLTNVRQGNQKYYLSFHPSVLTTESSSSSYNGVNAMYEVSKGGLIKIHVSEPQPETGQGSGLIYFVGWHLRLDHVASDDMFNRRFRETLPDRSMIDSALEVLHELHADSTRYWTDSGWVSEGAIRSDSALEDKYERHPDSELRYWTDSGWVIVR